MNFPTEVKVAVGICEELEEAFNAIGKNFIEYMDKNNLWIVFDDDDLMCGSIHLELEEVLVFFNKGLTTDERNKIISWYNSTYN